MEYNRKYSRVNKFKRHRSLTKRMTTLLIVAGCLVVILGILITLTQKDQKARGKNNNNSVPVNNLVNDNDNNINGTNDNLQDEPSNDDLNEIEDESVNNQNTDDELEQNNNDEDQEIETGNEVEIDIEQIPSEEENILEAFTGNWGPVGTIQEEPHVTDYANESQDRIEMNQAVSLATGLAEDDIITWWVGNGGEQKVIVTVSDQQQNEIYRVYLSWITSEGWQPTKVERLKENDIEYN